MLRFYAPTQGDIFYGKEPISAFTPESWRERIAMCAARRADSESSLDPAVHSVPQDPALFSDTIAENSEYADAGLCRSR